MPKAPKQQSLVGFLSSSPLHPLIKANTTSEASSKSKAKSRRVSSPGISEYETSDVAAIHFEPETITLTDEEEPTAPRILRRKKRKLRLVRADSDSDVEARELEEEEIGVPVRWKGRKTGKMRQVKDSDSDESPRKRKLVKGERPLSPDGSNGIEDEVDEADIIDSRLRSRGRKTAFQKNLEKLQRKKRGLALSDSPGSEEDASNSDDVIAKPFAGARKNYGRGSSDEDAQRYDEDDGFIVEDDGSMTKVELPAEFSLNTYQDLAHHFKTICQLLVHLIVRPPGERLSVRQQMLRDQWFSVPLTVARRKLDGLRDSLVVSSVWRPEFKKPLELHPDFELVRLDFAVPTCDACHLGGRMSTRLGRVSGTPYNRDTFEPDTASDDSEDEDDRHNPPAKEFHLGRFCANRSLVFHKFMHWEYSLYKALSDEIDVLRIRNGEDGFVRIAYSGGIVPPDDLSDADGIMAWLDQRRVIEIEWRKINDMMDSARNLEVASKRGEDADNL